MDVQLIDYVSCVLCVSVCVFFVCMVCMMCFCLLLFLPTYEHMEKSKSKALYMAVMRKKKNQRMYYTTKA